MARPGRSPWRFGVPVVCLCAGLLLATTHTASGGNEIRRSDAPRLVDLVREAQAIGRRAFRPARDDSSTRSTTITAAPRRPTRRSSASPTAPTRWPPTPGWRPLRGPGLVVTLDDAQRDAEGRFPGDASADDLVVHQQDIQAVLNALWSAGAEGIQMQDQRIIATSAPRCVGNTLLLNGRTYSPPYVITAIGDVAGDAGGAGRARRWSSSTSSTCCGSASATPRSPGRRRGGRPPARGADALRQARRSARLLSTEATQ